jgi:hypothetical protein
VLLLLMMLLLLLLLGVWPGRHTVPLQECSCGT